MYVHRISVFIETNLQEMQIDCNLKNVQLTIVFNLVYVNCIDCDNRITRAQMPYYTER